MDTSLLHHELLEHGELLAIRNYSPLMVDVPGMLYYVTAGQVEIFSTERLKDKSLGTRENLVTIPTGEIFLSMDSGLDDLALMASGVLGTQVVAMSVEKFRAILTSERVPAEEFAALLGLWTRRLGERLAESQGDLQIDLLLQEDGTHTVTAHTRVGCVRETLWLASGGGDMRYLGLTALNNFRGTLLPLSGGGWVESMEDTTIELKHTESALGDDALWDGLTKYHQQFIQLAVLKHRVGTLSHLVRQATKESYREAALHDAVSGLVAVMGEELPESLPAPETEHEDDDLLLTACGWICEHLDLKAKRHPDMKASQDMSTNLALMCKASGFRTRSVRLEGEWWTKDHGPLLGFRLSDRCPVAILPWKPGGYYIRDAKSGSSVELDAETAATLVPYAECIYRSFPDGQVDGWRFVRFAARGLGPEFRGIIGLSIAAGLMTMMVPLCTSKIFDSVIPAADREMLFHYSLALITAALANGAFEIARGIAVLRVEGTMDQTGQAAIWSRLLDLPMTFFRRYTAGDLAERAYAVDTVRTIISQVGVTTILGSSTILFQGAMMLYINLKLAAVGLILVTVMTLVILTANWFQLRFQRREYGIAGRITGIVLQLFTGVSKIRVAAAEDHAFRLWAREFSQQKRVGFVIGRIQNFVQVFNAGYPILCSMVIFAIYLHLTKGPGAEASAKISTGDFIAFNAALSAVVTAVVQLALGSLTLLEIVPIFERVKPILTETPEVTSARRHPGDLRGSIELYHVNFRYTENTPLILKGVDIKINKGEFVAIVGPSGSGKSTILRLLLGFDAPESGYVYYDGQDLNTLDLREVRKQVGAVLQSSQLMPTTIYQNIIGSRSQYTIDDAWRAARMSGLDEDIRAMPMGMQTVVSEGGGGFSGGQKQRLMIARALISRPRIVYFDEATSALDNRTQRIVTDSLRELDATRVTIAHRLSIVADADRIIVLKGGNVAELGNHEELMEIENGIYRDLVSRQKVEEPE